MKLSDTLFKTALIYTSVSALLSCKIEEGEGGQAQIIGRVMVQKLYSNPLLGIVDSVIDEYPAVDQKLFISYGDNIIYDDDFSTNDQGYYKFEELTKGNYLLETYSYCKGCENQTKVVRQNVVLKSHKAKYNAPIFYIQEK